MPTRKMPRRFAPGARLLVAAGLMVWVGLIAPARADVRTDARALFRQGMASIGQGEYQAGIDFLQRAYELLPHPVVLFNIGRAYVDIGQLEEGIAYLERYLRSGPADAREVQATVGELRAKLARQQQEAEQRLADAQRAERLATPGSGATDDQLAVLKSILAQLEALAEVVQSEPMYQRVAELRSVIAALERAGPTPPPPTGTPSPPAEPPPVAVAAPGDPSQKPEPNIELSTTQDAYESQVVSASRFARTPLDAPNSTTVVTAQDIRLSGLTNIADLLRRVAGVEVMTLTPGNTEVSIRGLNQRLSNKVLVLVNGRSVYLDFLGATLWRALPVNLEDIERIEVIRGPASAIYGADAMTGIVNIILNEPGEPESYVAGSGGNGTTVRTTGAINGTLGDLGYRIAGGYERADQYSLMSDPERLDLSPYTADPTLGLQTGRLGGEVLYRPAAGWTTRAGGAFSYNQFSFQSISRLREMYINDSIFSQAHASLETPIGLGARVFWNYWQNNATSAQSRPGGVPNQFEDLTSHVLDVELTYSQRFELLVQHALAAGVGYRFKSVAWDWIETDRTENHFSVFLEDTMELGDHVLLALSGRLDRHPLLADVQISPRVSVVVRPTEGISLRALAGSAFRSPSFIESYLRVDNGTSVRGVTSFGLGNTNLQPERLFSVELGYAQEVGDFLTLEANGYFNAVLDQITLTDIQRYTLGNYPGFSNTGGGYPVGQVQFENEDATFGQWGGEVGVRFFPVRGLDIYANYAIHDTSPFESNIDLGGRELDERTSMHKVNGGVQYRSTFGLDAAVDVHYVSHQTWVEQVTDEQTGARFESFRIPGYVLLNARVGYRLFDDQLELAVSGFNLLGQRHRQHPFGQRIDTRVLGSATVRF